MMTRRTLAAAALSGAAVSALASKAQAAPISDNFDSVFPKGPVNPYS